MELHFTPNTTLYSIRFRTPNACVEDAPFVIDGIKYTPRLSGSTEKMLAESFVANRVIIANIDRLLNIITFESGNGSGGSSRVPDILCRKGQISCNEYDQGVGNLTEVVECQFQVLTCLI